MAGKKDKRTDKITVEFEHNYVASVGAAIHGAAGDVKTFAWSEDLERCLESGVCKVVKQPAAAKREKAKTD